MDTPSLTSEEQSSGREQLAERRRATVIFSWWILGLAFAGAILLHPICYCPVGFYVTGVISLLPLILGFGGHRWAACIALAFSVAAATSELIAERSEKEQAAKMGTQELIREFNGAFRAYNDMYGRYPSGPPAEIVATITGKNPQRIVFVDLRSRDLNAAGELIDSWNTPIHFVRTSDNEPPHLISAGPDRKFGTEDDIALEGPQQSLKAR